MFLSKLCRVSFLTTSSDILAELNYPHSGLAAVQETMPYPRSKRSETLSNGFVQREPMDYYHLQLYLRKRLNEMHSNLYAKARTCPEPMNATIFLLTYRSTHGSSLDFGFDPGVQRRSTGAIPEGVPME